VSGRYGFRHALYQEVLNRRLGSARRRRWHRALGARLESGYGAQASQIAAALAVHFERGRDYPRAVRYLQQAADNALQRYAYQEALGHVTRGLEMLRWLPQTPTQVRQELACQMTLGAALMTLKGYAAPEVAQAYTRARELCLQLEETSPLFSVLWGLGVAHQTRGEFQPALAAAEQLMTMAQRTPDAVHLSQAHRLLASAVFWSGDLARARQHAEQGLALYDRHQHAAYVALYGHAPGIACLAYASMTLLLQGYPDQALQRSQEVLQLARELEQPLGLAMALSFTGWLHYFRAEPPVMYEQATALQALAHEQGFPLYAARGLIMEGWVLVEQGHTAAGIAQMHEGLRAYRATGARMEQTHRLALLAEAYRRHGQTAAGLAVLADALEAVHTTGEHCYEAELYRLKGELLLAASATQQTEGAACVRQSLDIARHQQAKFLELRATLSQARLWQRQGKPAEAHALLAPIYGWFTEGFDTADLQDAKALLEELS
jgi:predicted ATPase